MTDFRKFFFLCLKHLSEIIAKSDFLKLFITFLAPEFVDQKSFMETEHIFSRIGPYICLLPDSQPKQIGMLLFVIS